MTTLKMKLYPFPVGGREGTLCYTVTHKRKTRIIPTGYRIMKEEWDTGKSDIIINSGNNRKAMLKIIRDKTQWELAQMEHMIRLTSEENRIISADLLAERLTRIKPCRSMTEFTRQLIEKKCRIGKIRTAETYMSTLRSFMKFRQGEDLCFTSIDSDTINMYEAYMKTQGLTHNTRSFYMRILKAIYNTAAEEGLAGISPSPFRYVCTGMEKTARRAVSLAHIKRIKATDCRLKPHMELARDMFLFSFYTRGMAFVDMAYLKKTDLKEGILTYHRKKTGQKLHIKWDRQMEEIIERYSSATASTKYLLPIITKNNGNERQQYRNAQRLINRKLKIIGRMAGLPIQLTLYVSRHSWASIAKAMNTPVGIISEALGHNSEKTTLTYLSTLDTSAVDIVNKKILEEL